MRKKVLVLMVVLMLALIVTGCSCSNNSSNKAAQGSVSDNETKNNDAKAVDINVGQTADVGFASISIDSFEVTDGYSFEAVKNDGMFTYRSSINCPSGMKLVCLRGTFTNKTTKEYSTYNSGLSGTMKINGADYKMKLKCYNEADAQEMTSVVPQQSASSYFYAEVPVNVADSIQQCVVEFGFSQDLNPVTTSYTYSGGAVTKEEDELPYRFKLTALPVAV